jgi:hypothetical protein
MENVANIEEFLQDFIEWYDPFLASLEEFGLGEEGSDAVRISHEEERKYRGLMPNPLCGTYDSYENTMTGQRGDLEVVIEKAIELRNKVRELGEEHGVGVNVYFDQHIRTFYEVFVTALEFEIPDTTHKMLVYLKDQQIGIHYELPERVVVMFNRRPIMPEGEEINPHCNRVVKGDGEVRYMSAGDGFFDYKCENIANIHMDYLQGDGLDDWQWYLANALTVVKEKIGDGALTCFLNILEEDKREY